MISEKHIQLLESMSGCVLQEVSLSKTAVRLSFLKVENRLATIFWLKTSCFVIPFQDDMHDYERAIQCALPVLYRNIDERISEITYDGHVATLLFSSNDIIYIIDKEKIWDNTFIIEVRQNERSEDIIF